MLPLRCIISNKLARWKWEIGQRASRRVEKRFNHPNSIWVWRPGRCWHCDRLSFWVDICFECPLHPGFCADQKDKEYFRSIAEGDLVQLLASMRAALGQVESADSTVRGLLAESAKALKFYGREVV